MAWQFSPYAIFLLLATVLLIAAALYVLHKQTLGRASTEAAILLITCAAWLLFNGLEAASTVPEFMLTMSKIEYLGVSSVPTAWLVYALRYTGYHRWLNPVALFVYALIPTAVFILALTNDLHGLMWTESVIFNNGTFTTVSHTRGVAFWLFTIHSYLIILFSIVLLIRQVLRSRQLYMWQTVALIMSLLAPLVSSIIYLFGINPFPGADLIAISFAITAPIAGWGLQGLRQSDIVPVSKAAILDNLSDGVIVLDEQRHVMFINDTAKEMFNVDSDSTNSISPDSVWLDNIIPLLKLTGDQEVLERKKLTIGSHTYDYKISVLKDWSEKIVSYTVILHDITTLKQRADEMTAMFEASQALSSSLELGQVLLTVAQQMSQISGLESCIISESQPEIDRIRSLVEYVRAVWTADSSERYAIEDYPTSKRVLLTGKPEIVHSEMALRDNQEIALMQAQGLDVLLILPVKTRETIIGLAEIGSVDHRNLPGPEIIEECAHLLDKAASWLIDPLYANTDQELFSIAEKLRSAGRGTVCTLSGWDRQSGELYTLVEMNDTVWSEGQGPTYQISPTTLSRVLNDHETVINRLDDLSTSPIDSAELERWGHTIQVVQPLIVRRRSIGLVQFYSSLGDWDIKDEQLDLWQALLNQAAVAIEHAQLYTDLQQRLEEQIALRIAGATITSELDRHVILTQITQQLCRIADVTSAYICTFDIENNESTVMTEYYGPDANDLERVSDVGTVYVEDDLFYVQLMESGRHDIDHIDDPDLRDDVAEHMKRYDVCTILYIPLRVKDKPIGYAELWESRQKREFSPREIELCFTIAQQAAIALENARLYDLAQQEIVERRRIEAELAQHRDQLEDEVTKRTALLRAANQELLMLGELKDKFIANVSHELRTPVTSLKLYLDLLSKRPDKREKYFHTLLRETNRLERIIEDILFLARMDQHRVPMRLESVDLNDLIENFVLDRLQLAQHQKLELSFEPAEKITPVQADRELMERVLNILFTNAFNFTPADGQVTFKLFMCQKEDVDWVVISISDTGPGIPVDEQPQIFDRFFRGVTALRTNSPGTGLGLSIAYEIVTNLLGHIEIDSEGIPGKGTTFTVWLPSTQ